MKIELIRGDVVRQPDLDAVVNAANAQLMPGGGVAGAIHRAAGPALARACASLAPIQPGQAVLTEAFDLPNRYVIHALGPRYGIDEPADELLARAYRACLRLCIERELESVGFPAISSGAFGFPLEPAAQIALRTVREHAPPALLVRFVLFDDAALETFTRYAET